MSNHGYRDDQRAAAASRGSALPTAMIFSVIGLLTVTTFLGTQHLFTERAARQHNDLQALFTARAGLWAGLAVHSGVVSLDATPINANTFSALGGDLFSDITDSAYALDEKGLGEKPREVNPFSSDAFGACSLSLTREGLFERINSSGYFRTRVHRVSALLGSRMFRSPDTVLYLLDTTGKQLTVPLVTGAILVAPAPDSATGDTSPTARFFIDRSRVQKSFKRFRDTLYLRPLTEQAGTAATIQSQKDLENFPRRVDGSLLIDGSTRKISWNDHRTVIVAGDLQLTGEVSVKGLQFIVGGTIKLFGTLSLDSTILFSENVIFFGDENQECKVHFQGQALAGKAIEVCKNTVIDGRSLLIVDGGQAAAPAAAPVADSTAGGQPNGGQPGGGQPAPPTAAEFALFLRDRTRCQGICISLSQSRGIKTFADSRIEGVLWSNAAVCHRGKLKGVMLAHAVVGGENCEQPNTVSGSIKGLDNIGDYFFPPSMGHPTVAEWRE
jgi:hypothetical protein